MNTLIEWKGVSTVLAALLLLVSCSSEPEKVIHGAYVVEIRDMKFHPAELTVKVGDTVTWANQDLVAHDITEQNTKAWSSSLLSAGKTWSKVITQNEDYFCSIHEVMKGKIFVQ
jgi:plastocyanin